MSSDEDIHDDFEGVSGNDNDKSKKRRIQRACDTCRRKKIRCDGSQMVDNRCTNCITWNQECTYIEAAKKRGPPKGYVESLENRLEKMEKLLRSLCPDADFTKELGTFIDRETWYHERSSRNNTLSVSASTPSPNTSVGTPLNSSKHPKIPSVGGMRATPDSGKAGIPDEEIPLSDEEVVHMTLAEGLKDITLNINDRRFHGKSSGIMLVQAAMDFKREFGGVGGSGANGDNGVIGSSIPDNRREEFWIPPDWESTSYEEPAPPPEFPEDDLVRSLFDLFFEYTNAFYPIHHRPTLEKNYAQGLHLTSKTFAATLLLTCAVASRWSDDPRVFVDESKHSAGWRYFEQAQSLRRNTLAPPTLFDVQVYSLSALFLNSSAGGQASWTMIGIGIRLAQDVGAHRRKVHNAATTVEDEQWKRAFWVLVSLDRAISSSLGRPCAVQDEDFDLDHPLEVDDEFWESPRDPSMAFKQPPERPPKVAFFNCFLKLNQILAFALRTIYSINKSKILLGFVGPQWEQHIVAELDSALNKWIDSVPDHLRWDPNREDPLFFAQSATLYATYYHLQILIHRPFIPTPRKPSPLSFPSLAICTNAARSCSHVLDVARRRLASKASPITMSAAFTSGIVLLLNIWGAKKSGMQSDPAKQMQDVHKCMQHLKDVELRFRVAGRLWDILYELASVGELPLPQPSPPGPSHKRERDSDTPIVSRNASKPSDGIPTIQRPIAKSRATTTAASRAGSGSNSGAASIAGTTPPPPMQPHQPAFNTYSGLRHPLSSANLGQMPLHMGANNQVEWSSYLSDPTFGATTSPNVGPQHAYGDQTTTATPQPSYIYNHGNPGQAVFQGDMFSGQGQMGMGAMMPGQHPSTGGTFGADGRGHHVPSGAEITMGGMWSNAPPSFELDDWGTWVSSGVDPSTGFIAGVPPDQEMQHGQQHGM